MPKHKIGIVGATGYTGSELVRLLLNHPDVRIEIVTSESRAGEKFVDIHPQFSGLTDLELQPVENLRKYDLDLVFLALPHGISMEFVKEWGVDEFRIIDLSGDYRLSSPELYEEWYRKKHVDPGSLGKAAFGLSELFRDRIRTADLVANPGCYPTSAILALTPLLEHGFIEPENIIIDSKSGVTGAGAKANAKTHFPEVFGNFSAYGLSTHRHTPEIQSTLENSTGIPVQVLFTPHLIPIDRGILTTTYSVPRKNVNSEFLEDTFFSYYEKEHFIRVVDNPPNVKHVRGSNFCDIYVKYDERTNTIITVSTIDNLMKGAAGQAVQNMNIMFGFIERSGLEIIPLSP